MRMRGAPSLNVKQLRYVLATLSQGSFSAAATREGVSVQAVSKAVSELEREIGGALFERASSGVHATALGEALAARARAVVRGYDDLARFVSSGGRDPESADQVRLGFCCPRFPGTDCFLALIKTTAEHILRQPVDVSFTTGRTCLENLRARRLDALVTIGALREPGVTCVTLGTMPPYALMSGTNSLALKAELTLEDINACPVVFSRDFDHFNESVCRTYLDRGMSSELVELTSERESIDFFERRGGLALIAGGKFASPTGRVVARPIAEKDRVMVPICLLSLGTLDVSCEEIRGTLAQTSLFA